MRIGLSGLSVALALAAAPAIAQEDRDWNFQITPYLWGSGVGGDVTPLAGGPTVEFDESLSDLLEHLDAAFFLSAYARRGRWVFLGDFSASTSSRDGVVPPGLPAEGELRQRSLTLAAGYRVLSEPRATLDLLAGLRSWDIEVSAAAPAAGLSVSRDVDFTDPILAARGTYALNDRWSAMVLVDFGGFGAGSESTTQTVATLTYQMTENLYLSGGWRRLHVDYEDDGTGFEATLSGPLLGVTWRF